MDMPKLKEDEKLEYPLEPCVLHCDLYTSGTGPYFADYCKANKEPPKPGDKCMWSREE